MHDTSYPARALAAYYRALARHHRAHFPINEFRAGHVKKPLMHETTSSGAMARGRWRSIGERLMAPSVGCNAGRKGLIYVSHDMGQP
jgi:hypothetical protein